MSIFDIFQSKKKKTILFVEDEFEVIEQYKNLIGSDKELNEKFNFVYASNRKEFHQFFPQCDGVVSDYYMGSLRFEEVWIACEKTKPLTLISGEIKKVWPGPTSYKPLRFKNLKKAILDMMENGQKAPEFVKKSTKVAA